MRGRLLFECNLTPQVYVPLGDIARRCWSRATHHALPVQGRCPYRRVRVGERLIEDAIWLYEQPIEAAAWLGASRRCTGRRPTLVRRGRARDLRAARPLPPRRRRRDARPVRVTAGGELIAESERAELLFETGSTPVYSPAPTSSRAASPPPPSAPRARTRARRPTGTPAGSRTAPGPPSPLPESLAVARPRGLRRRGHRGRGRRAGRPLRARRGLTRRPAAEAGQAISGTAPAAGRATPTRRS